ncbi:thiazole biosynthesis protein ThiG, putative [Gloeomargarita lithophora Alchichica-D10]|uniref:glycine oxidase n=1 Tax=Gloeomargarita lithophora Alchichica-D10 TaxID=1188229 RepID=A0A1J0ADH4_9CYAN|nr:glycine oxidase ThiO [Gloeomargarita lithophora]APB33988.1 thiazole biosynthesis protein ThiG, putative [Gloeomargarita lithophora Alchichica-D10]
MDVLIIGGGIIGLSTAVELAKTQRQVGIVEGGFPSTATPAAAGMLAPGAEQIPAGALLDLCQASLQRYPTWIQDLEERTGKTTGYWPCGILVPVTSQAMGYHRGIWLNRGELDRQQPGLGAQFQGGWWYPDNGQVDNRLLTQVLRHVAQTLGVHFFSQETVVRIEPVGDRITQVVTHQASHQAAHYILTTGAWTQKLLSLPVHPRKGQMLALQAPHAPALNQVVFASAYLVPRRDGRLVVGATNEDVGFQGGITAGGLHSLLERAIHTYPPLQDWPILETWWGYRPVTPDECPILGPSPWENLTLATGHYRNGILLAPITAELIGNYLNGQPWPSELDFCRWNRFASSLELL